ncbi:MAG: hypothetical protein WD049_05790 [Candidatus Paceibacterota bacterium]
MTFQLNAQDQQRPGIVLGIPTRKRERETIFHRITAPRSRIRAKFAPSSSWEAIEADLQAVERGMLKLVQEVAG